MKSYSTKKGVKNNKTEFFTTPESIKQDLLSLANIDFSDKVIFDPCAGDGALTRGLKAKKIIQWDLEPRAEGIEQHDALTETWPKADVVVCNPPFTKTKEFHEKCKEYNHVFFITTWGRCRKWLVTNFKQNIQFPGVRVRVCLLYIDKLQDNQPPSPPIFGPFNLTTKQVWQIYRDTVFKDAKVVNSREAEKLQDSHFITRLVTGRPNDLKKTWQEQKTCIEGKYGSVQKWEESSKLHRFVAIPKTAYCNFDTNTVIKWMKSRYLKVPENLKYCQGIDCIVYMRKEIVYPVFLDFPSIASH